MKYGGGDSMIWVCDQGDNMNSQLSQSLMRNDYELKSDSFLCRKSI